MSLVAYLKNEVAKEYLELLPSRWSALLQRLAQETQQLQKSRTIVIECDMLSQRIADDFMLAQHLLETEHKLYRKGVTLLVEMKREIEHENNKRTDETNNKNSSKSRKSSEANVDSVDITNSCIGILPHLELFFQGFVTELTMKETMLAHWHSTLNNITSDTLRVYAHAMLTHKQVSLTEIERLTFMLQNTSRAIH